MTEQIYFVDGNDRPTGEVSDKLAAHHSDTQMHAAFSCYVFNDKGQFLITKRAASKKVWPNVWTNSCCGHPMPEESREDAVVRRVAYELELEIKDVELVVAEYTYKTPPYNGIIEHEYCPIYVARATSNVQPNPDEVAEYEWVDWQYYVERISNDSDDYSNPMADDAPVWSYWCKDQLKHLESSDAFQEFISSL